MVDALLECWRVLGRAGTLVDLRPLHADRPVELLTAGSCFVPGHVVDITGEADDAACVKALEHVVCGGYFTPRWQESFEFAVYWDSLAGFAAFAAEKWLEKRRLAPQVIERARSHVARTAGPYRLRIRYTMHIATYSKQETGASFTPQQ